MSDPGRERGVGEKSSRARIEQRLLANSGLIIGARAVTACLSLATIPVVVSRLGVVGYGTWEALLALASLTAMFQGAINGTLIWRISEAYGRDDMPEIRRLARLGFGASWALFLLLYPAAWFLREPAMHFLGVSPETRELAAGMFPIVAAIILLGGLSETLEAVVSGCQRTGLVNVVSAIGQILNYSVVIVLILFGGGLWSLVAGQAIGLAGRLAGAWIAARVAYGAVSLVPLAPRRADLSMARYSGLLTVGSVAAALRDQTDKIILAAMASPEWVGYYGIAARLSGVVMEVIRFVYVPMLTAVGALKAAGDWEGVGRLYSRLMAIVSVVTGMIVVVVAGLADRLVVLWIGHSIPQVPVMLWFLIAGSASAAMLTGPGTAICRGAGRVGIETTYLSFNVVMNLILTLVLVLALGGLGTAVATGSTWALSSVLFLFLLHRNLDLPVKASQKAGGTAILAAAVAVGAHYASTAIGLPEGRHDALLSVVWLGSASLLVYLGLLVSSGLASVSEAYGYACLVLQRAE